MHRLSFAQLIYSFEDFKCGPTIECLGQLVKQGKGKNGDELFEEYRYWIMTYNLQLAVMLVYSENLLYFSSQREDIQEELSSSNHSLFGEAGEHYYCTSVVIELSTNQDFSQLLESMG